MPQGTVLGPLLFLCFSADLPNVIQHSKLSIYADDTKLYKVVEDSNDGQGLQDDLNRIHNWTKLWQMELNSDKTKLLSIGNTKYNHEYFLDGSIIERVSSMNDVGVIIQSNLKFTQHCSNVIKKAHFVMRNIFNTFRYHNYNFYTKLYVCYIRPILEYASQVWSPRIVENINRIEKVQRYFTRRIVNNGTLSYVGRLELLGLQSLEHRRMLSDLVLFYKTVHGLTCVAVNDSYAFVNYHRGHNYHLFKHYCRTDRRKWFWINRIVNNWNKITSETVNCQSISSFKRNIRLSNFIGRGSMYCS